MNAKNMFNSEKNTYFNIFSGIVKEEKIKKYDEHRDELIGKSKSASFKNAIHQLEQYMSDRVVKNIYLLKLLVFKTNLNVCRDFASMQQYGQLTVMFGSKLKVELQSA